MKEKRESCKNKRAGQTVSQQKVLLSGDLFTAVTRTYKIPGFSFSLRWIFNKRWSYKCVTQLLKVTQEVHRQNLGNWGKRTEVNWMHLKCTSCEHLWSDFVIHSVNSPKKHLKTLRITGMSLHYIKSVWYFFSSKYRT